MNRAEIAKEFYIEDHAVIYGLLVKNATQLCGDSGMDSSVKGTILYAKERGLRMAMRAAADGEELTPNNYIAYGEWVDSKKLGKAEIKSVTPEQQPGVRLVRRLEEVRSDGVRQGVLYLD